MVVLALVRRLSSGLLAADPPDFPAFRDGAPLRQRFSRPGGSLVAAGLRLVGVPVIIVGPFAYGEVDRDGQCEE